jgi:hypothetical protein
MTPTAWLRSTAGARSLMNSLSHWRSMVICSISTGCLASLRAMRTP